MLENKHAFLIYFLKKANAGVVSKAAAVQGHNGEFTTTFMPDVTSSQKLVLEGEDLREYQEFLHSKVASTTMSTALIPKTFPVTKTTTTPKTTFSAKIVNRQALILDIILAFPLESHGRGMQRLSSTDFLCF